MRPLFIALLLSSVAAPSWASKPDNDARAEAQERVRDARAERAEQREERRATDERQLRASSSSGEVRQSMRVERSHVRTEGLEPVSEAAELRTNRARTPQQRTRRIEDGLREAPAASGDSVAGWRARERQQTGRTVSGSLAEPRASDSFTRQTTGRTRQVARNGVQGQIAGHLQRSGVGAALANPEFAKRWRSDWRRDRNHDWRGYRDRNRSLFHLGFYYDPFGYNYRRYDLGWTMWPSYYSDRYWLQDPWAYRLPLVGGSYRWVRYWDDAVLVDLRTGRVVDVIYDFFW
jgi:hypothetical protein